MMPGLCTPPHSQVLRLVKVWQGMFQGDALIVHITLVAAFTWRQTCFSWWGGYMGQLQARRQRGAWWADGRYTMSDGNTDLSIV